MQVTVCSQCKDQELVCGCCQEPEGVCSCDANTVKVWCTTCDAAVRHAMVRFETAEKSQVDQLTTRNQLLIEALTQMSENLGNQQREKRVWQFSTLCFVLLSLYLAHNYWAVALPSAHQPVTSVGDRFVGREPVN